MLDTTLVHAIIKRHLADERTTSSLWLSRAKSSQSALSRIAKISITSRTVRILFTVTMSPSRSCQLILSLCDGQRIRNENKEPRAT